MGSCDIDGAKASAGGSVDIAHISFLDMIKVMITLGGASNAKGTLIRNALNTADKIKGVAYDSFDDFLAGMEDHSNPITMVEGKAQHMGDFVFGLPACPFAPSIKNYTNIMGALPGSYAAFTEEFNKSTIVTRKYRVGEGAGVSPFCAVHQPLRSALGDKITIGGKKIAIYQLGCKASSGKKGLADAWLEETGVSREVAEEVLDSNMCCYYVKLT